VVKEAAQKDNIGGGWHTDHSYDEVPALGSILLAREVPPSGGNTLFASMYAAYDALPDYLKREIEGVRAVHSAKHIFGTNVREELRNADTHEGRFGNAAVADVLADVTHPIALVHPLSGRKAIYVNPAFTISSSRDEEAGPAAADRTLQALRRRRFRDRIRLGEDRWPSGTTAPPGTMP
jgi:taurine dioxygenase